MQKWLVYNFQSRCFSSCQTAESLTILYLFFSHSLLKDEKIAQSMSALLWGLLMWEIGRWLGHNGNHTHLQVVDRGTPSRADKRVAPDREGGVDKQCQGEGKLWSQYVITNRDEGKGKPPRLFPKTGYHYDIQNLLYSRRLKRERMSALQYPVL